MTTTSSSSPLDTAKELAPWRANLAWWIILVEGIVLAAIGLLTLFNPEGANRNLALIFTAALAVAGLLQLWSVFRSRVPDTIDSVVSGRASIAVFTGLVVILLYIRGFLTVEVGLIVVGLASLIYGLLGLLLVFKWSGAGRRTAIVEMIFFTLVGVLMLYAQLGGTDTIGGAIRIIAWLALVAGVGLIALAFYRRSTSEGSPADVSATSTQLEVDEQQPSEPVRDIVDVSADITEAAQDTSKEVALDTNVKG